MEAGETIPSTEAGTALFALLATVATAVLGDVRGLGRVAVASTAASSSSAVPTFGIFVNI